MRIIDSHTHIDGEAFDEDRDQVIERARQAGVEWIVNVGATDGFEGAKRSRILADTYDCIYISTGIHPHDSDRTLDIEKLEELSDHNKVVAIGETGLDFFRDWAPKDKQYEWFEAQIHLAKKLRKPLIIHSRDAARECLEVLKKLEAQEVGGVFHCYSEDAAFAKELFELNFIVSFPGNITFPKAEAMREAARDIPLEQMMVETDAPYLAPVPNRGKRCECCFVVDTARQIAEVKGISLDEVAEVTTKTALNFFGIPED